MTELLTLEAVEHHVSCLPREAIEQLASGPHEPDECETPAPLGTKEECCVCDVLLPLSLTPSRAALHAKQLLGWHDIDIEDLFVFADAADVDLDNALTHSEDGRRLNRAVFGALSYARCCTIYAAARALSSSLRAAEAA